MDTIKTRLHAACTLAGTTPRQVCLKLGIDLTAMYRALKKNSDTYRHWVSIAQDIRVPPMWLMHGGVPPWETETPQHAANGTRRRTTTMSEDELIERNAVLERLLAIQAEKHIEALATIERGGGAVSARSRSQAEDILSSLL